MRKYTIKLKTLQFQVEELQSQFEIFKQKMRDEGTPVTKNKKEYFRLYTALYRAKKKIKAQEAIFSPINVDEGLSEPIKKANKNKTPLLYVNNRRLGLLEDELITLRRYLKNKGVSTGDSKDYNGIKRAIYLTKLGLLEDELNRLLLYFKDKGISKSYSKDYNRIKSATLIMEQKAYPWKDFKFFHQKEIKKLVIKQRTLEFQYKTYKQKMRDEGTPVKKNKEEYRRLYMGIYWCKKKIAFKNLHTIEETYFL
jgi:hypothetical protein